MTHSILADVENPTLPLIIYGAGVYANHIYNELKKERIKVHAICVDSEFLDDDQTTWNDIPVFSKDIIYKKFSNFNLIIGFYTLHNAINTEKKHTHTYFYDDQKLRPIEYLPLLQEEMKIFFRNTQEIIKNPNFTHLYFGCKKAKISFSNYNISSNEIHLTTNFGTKIITNSYFSMLKEVFCDGAYSPYKKYIQNDYIIFDLGANRGYSALYFAEDEKCKKVYSFEPDTTTLKAFHKNISANPTLKEKITIFEYGLSDKDEEVIFYRHGDESDWANSINSEYLKSYFTKERLSKVTESKIQVHNASSIIKKIIHENHPGKINKVLKIDIEGAEYKVLQNLKNHGLLDKFDLIIGECHQGMDGVIDICATDFNLLDCFKTNTESISMFLMLNKNFNQA